MPPTPSDTQSSSHARCALARPSPLLLRPAPSSPVSLCPLLLILARLARVSVWVFGSRADRRHFVVRRLLAAASGFSVACLALFPAVVFLRAPPESLIRLCRVPAGFLVADYFQRPFPRSAVPLVAACSLSHSTLSSVLRSSACRAAPLLSCSTLFFFPPPLGVTDARGVLPRAQICFRAFPFTPRPSSVPPFAGVPRPVV